MSHDLLEPSYTVVHAVAATNYMLGRQLVAHWRDSRLLTVPTPPTPVAMGYRYSLLSIYELRILAEAAASGIDRKIIAWGFRKRLQSVGALQLVQESGEKPVAFYAGIGEVAPAELEAALRSGRLYEFARRDPADPVFWLIGFEREKNNNRGKISWLQTAVATKAEIGPALLALKPRASQVTGVVLIDVTAAVEAVHRVLDDLAKDRAFVARPGSSLAH